MGWSAAPGVDDTARSHEPFLIGLHVPALHLQIHQSASMGARPSFALLLLILWLQRPPVQTCQSCQCTVSLNLFCVSSSLLVTLIHTRVDAAAGMG